MKTNRQFANLRIQSVINLVLLGSLLGLFNGCDRSTAASGKGQQARPPGEVGAVAAVSETILDYRDFTGRTTAIRSVEIRVPVSGYLLQSPQPKFQATESEVKSGESTSQQSNQETQSNTQDPPSESLFRVVVQEGESVKIGTPLFEIDPAPYRFALVQAEGTLAATQAQLKRLSLDLARSSDLLKTNSISQADYDLAVANEAETVGQLAAYRANVDRAKLNLQFTRVVSPIDGLLGETMVTNGNLISADSTILTTIVSTDPIHAYFDVDEESLLNYRARILSGDVRSARKTSIPVRLGLANEEGFPHEGTIDFVDNVTDSNTGSTRVRGQFSNRSGALSPGLFSRVRVPFSEEYKAVLIPTRALAMDQLGRFCMVVDEKNIVHRRSVKIGTARESMTAVKEGISENERVVVSGLQKVRDGDAVRIVLTDRKGVALPGSTKNLPSEKNR